MKNNSIIGCNVTWWLGYLASSQESRVRYPIGTVLHPDGGGWFVTGRASGRKIRMISIVPNQDQTTEIENDNNIKTITILG